MHEPIFPDDQRRRAIREVEVRLQQLAGAAKLDSHALNRYRHRHVIDGWRLSVTFDGGTSATLYLLLDHDFPFARPLVAVDPARFLQWPHVESDGILCPLPDASTFDSSAAVAVVNRILGDAATLIEGCLKGEFKEDFRTEFYSYWNRTVPGTNPDVVSLISSFQQTRLVTLWRGNHFYLVADDESQASTWLRKRFSDTRAHSFDSAAIVVIPKPLLPAEYPNNGGEILRQLQTDQQATSLLNKLIRNGSARALIMLTAPMTVGAAIAPIEVSLRNHMNILGRKTQNLERGFRPGHVPENLQLNRFFASDAKLRRMKLERADATWVHGRGQNADANKFHSRKVAILGVGSVGGYLAEKLVSAGVGDLELVDPEDLTFANAGRHILGVDSQGKSKAEAVATLLQRRFPHSTINGYKNTTQQYLHERSAEVQTRDLLISTVGDWAADSYLNEWRLSRLGNPPHILLGWLEAHALAGHAVLLSQANSCLRCHFDDTGLFEFRLTEWPKPTQLQEPACGGQFQPYGPVDLSFTVSAIASLALEGLRQPAIQSTHRFYLSNEESIRSFGGSLTTSWRDLRKDLQGLSAAVVTIPWLPNSSCPRCRSTHA